MKPFGATLLFACLISCLISVPAHAAPIEDGHIATIRPPFGPGMRDADLRVPEHFRDLAPGYAGWEETYNGVATIWYDPAYMREHGATSCGWRSLMRHERAHAAGWDHLQGRPPDGDGKREAGENAAYSQVPTLYCRPGLGFDSNNDY